MADITQILNQRMSRYERERARLVEEYVTAARKMWQSLSPAAACVEHVEVARPRRLVERCHHAGRVG